MAKKKSFAIGSSLTQALTDTVSAAKSHSGELHVEIIPLRKIELDPDNPRDLVLSFSGLSEGLKTVTEKLNVSETKNVAADKVTFLMSLKRRIYLQPF